MQTWKGGEKQTWKGGEKQTWKGGEKHPKLGIRRSAIKPYNLDKPFSIWVTASYF